MGASPSPVDRLTDLERRVVKARLSKPGAKLHEVGRVAKIKGDNKTRQERVSEILKRPRVQMALTNPPPTVNDAAKADLSDPVKAKLWMRNWLQKIVEDPKTPQSERIRALDKIMDMTPGAKVPTGVHHTGTWTLEQFVAAAGGKPTDIPTTEEDEPRH